MTSKLKNSNIPTEQEARAISPAEQRKSRITLLSIIGIVLIPVLGSSFMYFTGLGIPTTSVNKGNLISPAVDLEAVPFMGSDGASWDWRKNGSVFKLVQFIDGSVSSGECSESCQNQMYTSRQVQTRLGRNSGKVIQVLVHSGHLDTATRQVIEETYPNLTVLSAELAQWRELLPEGDRGTGERLYVVDRRSHLVMYYDEGHEGGEILKDLNHLVKNVQ